MYKGLKRPPRSFLYTPHAHFHPRPTPHFCELRSHQFPLMAAYTTFCAHTLAYTGTHSRPPFTPTRSSGLAPKGGATVTNAFRVQRNTTRGAPDRPRTHDPRPGPPPRPRRLDIHPGRTQVQRTFRFRKRRVRPSSALDLSYPHQLGIVD